MIDMFTSWVRDGVCVCVHMCALEAHSIQSVVQSGSAAVKDFFFHFGVGGLFIYGCLPGFVTST